MNIIYLTSAIRQEEYPNFLSLWNVTPNPSNQNFHYRLIKSLSLQNNITVITLRPYNSSNCKIKHFDSYKFEENNTSWNYLEVKNNKVLRYISYLKETEKIIKNHCKSSIIIADSMNFTILQLANKMSKKFKMPLVYLLTDSPYNISFLKKKRQDKMIKLAQQADAYISLTNGLDDLYNKSQKPSVLVSGILDDYEDFTISKDHGDYLLFSGAMLPQYGVYNLIEAFKQIDHKNFKLIIAGHHFDKTLLNEKMANDNDIVFLGTLPYQEIRKLENGAFACINPRPFSESLDKYSIPSKTIEYASSRAVTISGINSRLQEIFRDSIIWLDDASPKNIGEVIERTLSLSENERNALVLEANQKARQYFSKINICEKITNFLLNIFK